MEGFIEDNLAASSDWDKFTDNFSVDGSLERRKEGTEFEIGVVSVVVSEERDFDDVSSLELSKDFSTL